MRFYVVSALLLLFLANQNSYAGIIDLGQFNILVKNDFYVKSSDTQGKSAIGGNLIIDGQYNLGTMLNANDVQVVAGDIIKTNPNQNLQIQGTLEYSGNIINDDTNTYGSIDGNLRYRDNSIINFDQTFAQFTTLSSELSQLASTGSYYHPWSTRTTFKASNNNASANLQIFNIDSNALNNMNELAFENIDDSQIVLNIFGETINYNIGNIVNWNIPNSDILFNFVNAKSLTLSQSINASILAPNADIIAEAGLVSGQIIANSWKANKATQINLNSFTATSYNFSKQKSVDVPEPSAMAIFLPFLIFFAVKRSQRS